MMPYGHQNHYEGASRSDDENHLHKKRDNNFNGQHKQQRKNAVDEERHAGRRSEEGRHAEKRGTATAWTSSGRNREEELAKSDRILNSLIEEVRHRNKGEANPEGTEENDDEGSGKKHKKHKKKKRRKDEAAQKPTLANILASAPLSFPWLTALGKTNTEKKEEEQQPGKEDGQKEGQTATNNGKNKAEQCQQTDVGQKAGNSVMGSERRTEHRTDEEEKMEEEETVKKTAKKKSHRRHLSKRSSPKRKRSKKSRRSRSRTYSTSPERAHCTERGGHNRRRHQASTSKSPSPLPPFSRQRAFETRRRLIEESWHRRIEHSVRPCTGTEHKSAAAAAADDGSVPVENDYTDANGRIDKQKLLEIATRNATRLAMEGKLPKGAELVETIKNKSVEQLVDLCKKVQSDDSLALKRRGDDASSNSDSDEERRYVRKYEKWKQKEQKREDNEFRNRAVRPAGEPVRISRREQKEIVQREENTLRLTFPVSSGVQHRVKTNQEPTSVVQSVAGPLVRFGDIGPLTTALAKVRTNIPAAYKPLSKPLPPPLSPPPSHNQSSSSTTLDSNSQDTSQVQIGPQQHSLNSLPNSKPLYPSFVQAKTLHCVNQTVYEIALEASARKKEAENREKAASQTDTVPSTSTSEQFIGPVLPNPIVESILTASLLLGSDNGSDATSTPMHASSSSSSSTLTQTTTSKSTFSSSWDRPGHIAAREALLKKIAEQKAQRENVVSQMAHVSSATQTAKEVPVGGAARDQQWPHIGGGPFVDQRQSELTPASSAPSSSQILATPLTTLASTSAPPVESAPQVAPTNQQQQQPNVEFGTKVTTTTTAAAAATNEPNTNDTGQFEKPSASPRPIASSDFGTPMLWSTTKNSAHADVVPPQRTTLANEEKSSSELAEEIDGQQGENFLDRFHSFVEAQVARQKAESALQATILSTSLQQGPNPAPVEEFATFSSSSFSAGPTSSALPSLISSRIDPIGLTRPQKSIQELATERLRYSQRLQRDPNDYEARKALTRVDKEVSSWAQDSSLPGEFTGHTGARVLSEKELGPSDPRFYAWAKKDQFRTAPEINSGIGMKLLQRMGWRPGQGLGRDRAGQLEPLALDVKADRKGLFSCLERAPTRESVLDSTGKNPISVLMEQCARNHWRNPEFSCTESGPQNSRRYHWKAVLNGVEYAPSLPSSNKKAGKAQVCMVILEALGMASNSL